ncbi:MAG: pyridoxal-dependent decarboxylase [Acidobacteriota bacterium]
MNDEKHTVDPGPPQGRQAQSEKAEKILETLSSLAREICAQEHQLPSRIDPSGGVSKDRFGVSISDEGHDLDDVVEALRHLVLTTPSSAGESFFNQLFGGRDPVATLAEMLTPILNSSMYTFKVAGPQVLVELEVLDRMAKKAGFQDGEGTFVPGGSIANLVAMIIARNQADPGARDEGISSKRLTAYTSDQSHYSIRKNAGLIGIGRDCVRKVSTDTHGHMVVEDLRRLIRKDREAGRHPFFINATAGTTVLGAFDPIRDIAAVAQSENLWMHIDGALGASVLLSETHRHLLEGSELADSITWNAHKMMGVPLSCSAILVKRRGLLSTHFNESASYLFQANDDEFNPGTRSIQCGRRNDALKLWAAWLFHGDAGYQKRIDRLFDLADYAAGKIAEDPDLALTIQPESINVCFEVREKSSAMICEKLDAESRLKIGFGEACGSSAIRLVCVNPDLGEEDVDRVLTEIKIAAESL